MYIKQLILQVRIDHRNKCLTFGTDLLVAQKEDVPEGPYIQSMPSEQIRNQLTNIAETLHKAINVITPKQNQVRKFNNQTQKLVTCIKYSLKRNVCTKEIGASVVIEPC